jgi:hypothetical protein
MLVSEHTSKLPLPPPAPLLMLFALLLAVRLPPGLGASLLLWPLP